MTSVTVLVGRHVEKKMLNREYSNVRLSVCSMQIARARSGEDHSNAPSSLHTALKRVALRLFSALKSTAKNNTKKENMGEPCAKSQSSRHRNNGPEVTTFCKFLDRLTQKIGSYTAHMLWCLLEFESVAKEALHQDHQRLANCIAVVLGDPVGKSSDSSALEALSSGVSIDVARLLLRLWNMWIGHSPTLQHKQMPPLVAQHIEATSAFARLLLSRVRNSPHERGSGDHMVIVLQLLCTTGSLARFLNPSTKVFTPSVESLKHHVLGARYACGLWDCTNSEHQLSRLQKYNLQSEVLQAVQLEWGRLPAGLRLATLQSFAAVDLSIVQAVLQLAKRTQFPGVLAEGTAGLSSIDAVVFVLGPLVLAIDVEWKKTGGHVDVAAECAVQAVCSILTKALQQKSSLTSSHTLVLCSGAGVLIKLLFSVLQQVHSPIWSRAFAALNMILRSLPSNRRTKYECACVDRLKQLPENHRRFYQTANAILFGGKVNSTDDNHERLLQYFRSTFPNCFRSTLFAMRHVAETRSAATVLLRKLFVNPFKKSRCPGPFPPAVDKNKASKLTSVNSRWIWDAVDVVEAAGLSGDDVLILLMLTRVLSSKDHGSFVAILACLLHRSLQCQTKFLDESRTWGCLKLLQHRPLATVSIDAIRFALSLGIENDSALTHPLVAVQNPMQPTPLGQASSERSDCLSKAALVHLAKMIVASAASSNANLQDVFLGLVLWTTSNSKLFGLTVSLPLFRSCLPTMLAIRGHELPCIDKMKTVTAHLAGLWREKLAVGDHAPGIKGLFEYVLKQVDNTEPTLRCATVFSLLHAAMQPFFRSQSIPSLLLKEERWLNLLIEKCCFGVVYTTHMSQNKHAQQLFSQLLHVDELRTHMRRSQYLEPIFKRCIEECGQLIRGLHAEYQGAAALLQLFVAHEVNTASWRWKSPHVVHVLGSFVKLSFSDSVGKLLSQSTRVHGQICLLRLLANSYDSSLIHWVPMAFDLVRRIFTTTSRILSCVPRSQNCVVVQNMWEFDVDCRGHPFAARKHDPRGKSVEVRISQGTSTNMWLLLKESTLFLTEALHKRHNGESGFLLKPVDHASILDLFYRTACVLRHNGAIGVLASSIESLVNLRATDGALQMIRTALGSVGRPPSNLISRRDCGVSACLAALCSTCKTMEPVVRGLLDVLKSRRVYDGFVTHSLYGLHFALTNAVTPQQLVAEVFATIVTTVASCSSSKHVADVSMLPIASCVNQLCQRTTVLGLVSKFPQLDNCLQQTLKRQTEGKQRGAFACLLLISNCAPVMVHPPTSRQSRANLSSWIGLVDCFTSSREFSIRRVAAEAMSTLLDRSELAIRVAFLTETLAQPTSSLNFVDGILQSLKVLVVNIQKHAIDNTNVDCAIMHTVPTLLIWLCSRSIPLLTLVLCVETIRVVLRATKVQLTASAQTVLKLVFFHYAPLAQGALLCEQIVKILFSHAPSQVGDIVARLPEYAANILDTILQHLPNLPKSLIQPAIPKLLQIACARVRESKVAVGTLERWLLMLVGVHKTCTFAMGPFVPLALRVVDRKLEMPGILHFAAICIGSSSFMSEKGEVTYNLYRRSWISNCSIVTGPDADAQLKRSILLGASELFGGCVLEGVGQRRGDAGHGSDVDAIFGLMDSFLLQLIHDEDADIRRVAVSLAASLLPRNEILQSAAPGLVCKRLFDAACAYVDRRAFWRMVEQQCTVSNVGSRSTGRFRRETYHTAFDPSVNAELCLRVLRDNCHVAKYLEQNPQAMTRLKKIQHQHKLPFD